MQLFLSPRSINTIRFTIKKSTESEYWTMPALQDWEWKWPDWCVLFMKGWQWSNFSINHREGNAKGQLCYVLKHWLRDLGHLDQRNCAVSQPDGVKVYVVHSPCTGGGPLHRSPSCGPFGSCSVQLMQNTGRWKTKRSYQHATSSVSLVITEWRQHTEYMSYFSWCDHLKKILSYKISARFPPHF